MKDMTDEQKRAFCTGVGGGKQQAGYTALEEEIKLNCIALLVDSKKDGESKPLFWLRINCPHDNCNRDIFLAFSVSAQTGDLHVSYSVHEPKEATDAEPEEK
jgi:hypothetical protein